MTSSPMSSGPALPVWEEIPNNVPVAIREVKAAIRSQIARSGRTVEEVFAAIEATVLTRVAEIEAANARGETSWTVLDYEAIASGQVSEAEISHLKRSGCLVVRGHFAHEAARQWDADIVEYVESNSFFDNYAGPGDDFFGSVGSKPEIYPIYWSPPQIEAQQSERMALVQSFLNHRWTFDSADVQWFEPDRHALYPDRIRRRPPGADSRGLGAHFDTGNLDLWMTSGYQQSFRHIFDGSIEDFDPWDAAYRTVGSQYPGSTMCSAFRTFQGWTALSDMANDQGVLRAIPIPEAIAYLLLRPLLDDIPDDEMCGVAINQVFGVSEEWHSELLRGFSSIPDVRAGDSVWWHCDVVHGVAPVQNQVGWGNVMYIPAAPWCERNETYAAGVSHAFHTGESPADFPAEHYERTWPNRFSPGALNANGRAGLGRR